MLVVTALSVVAGLALAQRLTLDWSWVTLAVGIGVALWAPCLWARLARVHHVKVALSFCAAGLSVALGCRVIDEAANRKIVSAMVMSACVLLLSFAVFFALIFVGMLCGFALVATGLLRRWLLIVALLPVSLLAAMIFSSNYRGRRILEWAKVGPASLCWG